MSSAPPQSERLGKLRPENQIGIGALIGWRILETAPDTYFTEALDIDPADEGRLPTSIVPVPNGFVISFADMARFHIDFANRTVAPFDLGTQTDAATLSHLLHDHVAPRIIAHSGRLVLHGSSVAIHGKVAVFLGGTGVGKSTLAASLHKAGHHLLGDDAVIISQNRERFLAEPVYRSLRLFPDAISALLDGDNEVSAMAHYSDKQRVVLGKEPDDRTGPLPIAALFFLSGDADAEEIEVRQPSAAQACIATLEQSFSLDPNDAARAAQRLKIASELIGSVDCFELEYPNGYDRLDEVHSAIEACVGNSGPAQTGAA